MKCKGLHKVAALLFCATVTFTGCKTEYVVRKKPPASQPPSSTVDSSQDADSELVSSEIWGDNFSDASSGTGTGEQPG